MKLDGFFIGALLTFALAAFSFGYRLGVDTANKSVEQIVCDHPDFQDSGFAEVTAECRINNVGGSPVKVVILD